METENKLSALLSGEGEPSSVTDSKSKASTDTEDNERNPLTLKKEDNKAMKHEAGSRDYSQAANQSTCKAYLDKCKRVEKENLEVKKKLKKMEKYNTDCKTELQKFVKRFKDFKNINKDLVSKNKQLLLRNQHMRRRIREALKPIPPQTENLEEKEAKSCKNQKKQEPRETAELQEEEKKFPESFSGSQQMNRESERMILTHLKQENQTLRERLELSSQVLKDAESRVERGQQKLEELEHCLLTVQTERNLLRLELKRLHQDFISLTNSISLQLRRNTAASLQLRAVIYSSTQQCLSINRPVGGPTA